MDEKKIKMFDKLYSSFRKIISNIAIIGYTEEDIIKRGINIDKKLELSCLYAYPTSDENAYNPLTYDMMFPDGNHKIESPKFFSLTLTDEKAGHSFLYCLKFPEKYKLNINNNNNKDINFNNNNNILEINVPLVLCIKSEKSDLEPFRQLLTSINQIIVSEIIDYDSKTANNYKKVELLNILFFIFSLPHTCPHSLVRLKLNNDLCEIEDEIDFYFSSNCEIPCNKNDTDINLLFLILDQSIIIKVIIAILSEKQLIFRASQAYLLHLIIPTFLKLIFPFKSIQNCITVVTKENIDYLGTPSSYIMGVLSSTIQIQTILKDYPGAIIVDCDTNEIFGENNNGPYFAPKDVIFDDENANAFKINKRRKNKNKKKEMFNNINGGIKQGKNIFIVDGSFIFQYDLEINGKGKKLKFEEKNNIIIDTKNSQFLINKVNDLITSDEIKWLRKNIQLVRNPEIFDLENINSKIKNTSDKKLLSENESIILPDRSFSYNIQNILMHFYLHKIEDTDGEFMEFFKDSNLYQNYLVSEKFQNNSGKRIIENINETINEPRSIDNCFIVEYNNKNFCALSIIDELDKKMIEIKNSKKNILNNINNENKDKKIIKDIYLIYDQLKSILMDYCLVLGITSTQIKNDFFSEDNKSQRISINSLSKSRIRHFKNNYHKGHIKSNPSLLQFTFNQNPNFNLAGIDKSSKNYFKFYGKDGFLYFLKNIEGFIKDEKKEFEYIIYKIKIYNQLINIYKNLDNIFKYSNEDNNDSINVDIDILDKDFNEGEENDRSTLNIINNISNNNGNSFIGSPPKDDNNIINTGNQNILEELRSVNSIRKTKNSIRMSMITEKEEENNESFIERSTTKKYTNKSNNEELGNILLNNININFKNEENIMNTNDENSNIEDIIIFPDFENKKEKEKDFMNQLHFDNNSNNININIKKIKKYPQYYLFLAYYLEEISSDKLLLEKFNKDIFNSLGTQININKFIIKLYKESYIRSGEKHRDFPYFTFYSYLNNLDNETLSKIANNLNEEINNCNELQEIYFNILNEKKISIEKNNNFNLDYNGNNTIYSDIRGFTINNTLLNNYSVGEDAYYPNLSIRPESYNYNMKLKNTLSNNGIVITEASSSYSYSYIREKNCSEIIVINSTPIFKPKANPKTLHILDEFCSLLINCFPSKEDIKTKNIKQMLNEIYIKINNQAIRELLGELNLIRLSILTGQKQKLCFWLNCFNFLSLFAIFYLKLNIIKTDVWKNFLKNIKFAIGGFNFSFEDMMYIIFQKNIFFPNDKYIPKDYIKRHIIDLTKDTNNELKEEFIISPLLLFLPNKEFCRPSIYDENDFDSDIEKRYVNSLFGLIRWDENKGIIIFSELLFILEPDFMDKGYKKFKSFIDKDMYKIIKQVKHKKCEAIIRPMKWEMSFNYLLEETCIES